MRNIFKPAVPALIAAGLSCQNLTARPHIIFIMTDQQRADALGCSGNDRIITPWLDSLAADGYLFSNAYTSCPSSTPARAGLLTGLSPWHHGMLGYGRVAEHYRYEMPQMLRDNGYFTFGIGKMHWFPQTASHGFHVTVTDESGRVESPYFMSDYRKWFQTNAPGENPDMTGIGWNAHGAAVYALPENLHPTAWTGDTAVDVIENYDGEEPLFLKVSFARPHSPYDPPERVYGMYDGIEPEGPAKGKWSEHIGEDMTDPAADPEAAFGQFGDEYVRNSKKHYYASITFVDEQVGRIINALRKKGMYDGALICFVSDHGDMMGDHGHWRKTYAYEGSSAIPMIIKLPDDMPAIIPEGSHVDAPVELRDILPTFLDAAGAYVPSDMDGKSVLPLLQTESPEWRRWIDLEHASCYARENCWCALTDGNIKYIRFLLTGKEQLFDLKRDPHETEDLSGKAGYRRLLEDMRAAMAGHLSERGEDWVKDGKIVVREESMLYSPNYPVSRDARLKFTAQPVDVVVDSVSVSGKSVFSLPGHFVWGASVAKADDGRYFMIYSASETGKYPFGDAWVLGSKMGLAVSDRPDGGFRHVCFFMNADGFAPDTSSWDAQTVSNPHLRRFGGRYYLYYAGSCDPGEESVSGNLSRRDRIQQNQKIGVISFDSFDDLAAGKFSRSNVPLLAPRTRVKPNDIVNPSPEGTSALPDNIITVNPSVVYRPSDGKYLLYFKGNVYDPAWRGVHGVAVSDSPDCGFVTQDIIVFHIETADGRLSAEDPFVWYDAEKAMFYAVFKDFNGQFTKGEPSLAIMESEDGIRWTLPENSMFMKKELCLKSGEKLKVNRLERPQILPDVHGKPAVLYAACAVSDPDSRSDGGTFNVQIPILTAVE